MAILIAIVAFFLLAAGISAAVAGIVYLLYSGIVVPVFGAPALTFFQVWGLWFLVGCVAGLFKSSISVKG